MNLVPINKYCLNKYCQFYIGYYRSRFNQSSTLNSVQLIIFYTTLNVFLSNTYNFYLCFGYKKAKNILSRKFLAF